MVSYGNGFKTRYEYDSLDRTSKIYQGTASNASSTAAYEFIYNGEGDLYELRNYKTHRATFFEYDHAGRCMASTEKTFTGGNGSAISYTGTVAGYKYEYDLNNSLTKLTCELIGTSWSTTYSYDNDNRPTTTLLHNGRSFVNTYDGIGRITSVKLKNGSSTILNTAITYVSGANGSKTALVSTYKNGNDSAYNYEYDGNGNITKIWRGSSTYDNATEKVLYTYDSANQLIQEDLYYGSGNSSNVTYQYSYDQWGNITSKKTYAYQNTSGTALSEDTYMYGNVQWGDKLLKFNGQTISYDSMGNPTSYLGTTLSWQGKQLTTYVGSSKTISFSYNEDGLRLKKTVNNVDTNYYYNGSVLMAMTSGTIYQRFSYDASGKVVSVDYSENSGSTYITYYYLRNAQGDIVKLIDGSGITVVEYAYDSWGKKLSTTGTLATTLGKYQPFRYRGYVYDEETQWYYLQSRYYDPTVRRFISADVLLSTGQGVLGHNAFAYCGNNPVIRIDDEGDSWKFLSRYINTIIGLAKVGPVVRYDVPLYNQGSYSLCWAFCQVMVEAYNNGITLTQKLAEKRAVFIAMTVAKSWKKKNWNKAGWPTNVLPDGAADVKIKSIWKLYSLLLEYGPIYAYYKSKPDVNGNVRAHLVVVTGVDVINGLVYTNNPHNKMGVQTFYEFLNGFYDAGDYPLSHCLVPTGVKMWRLL